MKEQVKEQFDNAAKDYDANRRMVIPHFDAFYNTGIDFLDYAGDAPHRARMSLDDPSPVGDQLDWMTAAGFSVADCLFKYNNFAVFYGKK
jgi:hypothetical protein